MDLVVRYGRYRVQTSMLVVEDEEDLNRVWESVKLTSRYFKV